MQALRFLPLVALPLLVGCSFHDDVVTICNAEELSGSNRPEVGVEKKAMVTANYIESHIHSGKGKQLFRELGKDAPGREKSASLQSAAKAESVTPCPFADNAAAKD